jgi:hypothetical protein
VATLDRPRVLLPRGGVVVNIVAVTNRYWYHDYIKVISERFVANLSTIETEHSFEYGPEFEIVLCKTLRSVLPNNYGIARGYVVNREGTRAGDDIVLFERSRFPTLGLREQEEYARKEFVPIEAAYAYIEAKHTLYLHGGDRQSLAQAIEQVRKVKQLCSQREEIPPGQRGPYKGLSGTGITATPPQGFPQIQNPMYGAIFARHVKRAERGPTLIDPQEIKEELKSELQLPSDEHLPDLIVLGENAVIVPSIFTQEPGNPAQVRSPFFVSGQSVYTPVAANGVAAGIALASLMFALDWIELGVMPWRAIIENGLGVRP